MASDGQDGSGGLKFRPQRSIVIGLGGSGADVLGRMRRLIVDHFGSLESLPIARFLYIDTDSAWDLQTQSGFKCPVPFAANEKLHIGVPDPDGLLENIRQGLYPNYRWFAFNELRNTPSINDGAGTIRQLGRLCFFEHYTQIRAALEAIVADLRQTKYDDEMLKLGLNLQPGITVHIVAGIAGGTGSGTFLDMAYLVRKVLADANVPGDSQTIGYVLLPTVFQDLPNSTSIYPNGYAALKELNYYTYRHNGQGRLRDLYGDNVWDVQYLPDDADSRIRSEEMPFDFCYLLDSTNGQLTVSRPQLFEMLARNIYFEFAHEFSKFKRSLRANVLKKTQAAGHDGVDCPAYYLSLGQSAVMFPAGRVKQVLAKALAQNALRRLMGVDGAVDWLPSESTASDGTADQARSVAIRSVEERSRDEETQRAVRAYIIREFVPNQGLDLAPLLQAVMQEGSTKLTDILANLKSQEMHLMESGRWPSEKYLALSQTFDQWKRLFDDQPPNPVSWGEHIRRMVGFKASALKRYVAAINAAVDDMQADPARGPAYAVAFLDCLGIGLENRKKQLLLDANNPKAIAQRLSDLVLIDLVGRMEHGDQTLSTVILPRVDQEYHALGEISRSWLLPGKGERLKAQATVYLRWCEFHLRAKIEERAHRLAAELAGETQTSLIGIRERVLATARGLATAAATLGRAHRAAHHAATTTEVLGQLLYDDQNAERLVDALIAKLDGVNAEAIKPEAIANSALARTGLTSVSGMSEAQAAELAKVLGEEAAKAMAAIEEEATGDTTFAAYDLLVALYGGDTGSSELTDRLCQAQDKSLPFVQLDRNADGGRVSDPFTARGVGMAGGNTGGDAERLSVLDALKSLGWNVGNEVQAIRDTSEIAFFQEWGHYPLRALASIRHMREQYENHRAQNGHQPLHIVNDTLALGFPDLLPPRAEALNLAFKVVAAGIALGLLPVGRFADPTGAEGLVQCHYYSRSLGLGETEQVLLGATRGSAAKKLVADPALAKEICEFLKQTVASASDAERMAMSGTLKEYLAARADEIKARIGDRDPKQEPEYRDERARVLEFCSETGLPAE